MDEVVKLGVGSRHIGVLEPGDAFGELALMYNTPRAATITALEDVTLWTLQRNVYRAICVHHTEERSQRIIRLLKTVPALKPLSDYEMDKLATAMELTTVDAGSVVIKQGEKGDYFYIVAEGELSCTKQDSASGGEEELTTLTHGMFFGEKALLSQETRAATVTAKTECELLMIKRQHFMEILGELLTRATSSGDLGELDRQSTDGVNSSRNSEDAAFANIPFSTLVIKRTLGCGASCNASMQEDEDEDEDGKTNHIPRNVKKQISLPPSRIYLFSGMILL